MDNDTAIHNLPIVALVGPMNVGKSTLFNRILGQRVAVTSDIAGTTRDRQYAEIVWNKKRFRLLDTADLSFNAKNDDTLEKNVLKQIQIAKKEADVLVFVVDGKFGTESIDRKVLLEFRKTKRNLILAVNKLDSPKNMELYAAKFAKLGIKPIVAISSITGRGIGDLLDEITTLLSDPFSSKPLPVRWSLDEGETSSPASIRIAIVGKPNVGKSSLFNKILKDERVVVSPVPGTTRTAIDSDVDINDTKFTFIDTAGLWRKSKKQMEPEVYSAYQVYKSIRRSDVCFFVIDISESITHQDMAIAQSILEQQKGCIILANKIDKLPPLSKLKGRKVENSEQELLQGIKATFPFLKSSPLFLVSANTGYGINDAIEAAKQIYEARQKDVHQDELNRFLAQRMKLNPPKRLRDQKIPRVFGLNQIAANPPAFELLVNAPSAIQEQFKRSLQNALIKDFGFSGTPVKLLVRKKI